MKKIKITREFVLILIFICFLIVIMARLYKLQVIEGSTYANNFELKMKKDIVLDGTRGCIFDRNGELLAGNKLVFAVTMEDSLTYDTNRERQLSLNGKIYKILQILDKNNESLNNELKIHVTKKGTYEFTASDAALLRFKADVYGKKKVEEMSKEQTNASAKEIMDYLISEKRFCLASEGKKNYTDEERKEYGLPDKFSKEETLNIAGIRYMLFLNTYQKYIPITLAYDVSEKTAAAILENQYILNGVDIKESSIRYYEGGEALSSILGYTGIISSDELEERGEGYTNLSIVGKAGIEQYLDESLQGKDGKKEVVVDNLGRIKADNGIIEAEESGEDVYLSIDKDLQIEVYNLLEKKITDILIENIINHKEFNKDTITDASEIKIPVYDVYYALINNNIIDINQFSKKKASDLEKSIYQQFLNQKESILSNIKQELKVESAEETASNEQIKEAEKIIMNQLNILDDSNKTDEIVSIINKWNTQEITIKECLESIIQENGIDQTQLSTEEKYLTSDQTYELLVDYIMAELDDHVAFQLLVYKFMIYHDIIPLKDVGLLLYEQGTLSKEDETYSQLQSGQISAFSFIVDKLKKTEITPANLALDPFSGSVVITETGTGKVLACVSYPGYDNNRLVNNMDTEYYYKLYNDKSIPFYNRATQQLSAPGSTFKPITVIAGLNEQVISTNTELFCDGVFDKVETPLKCWKRSGHGAVKGGASALQHSCNDYLCEISYLLGSKDTGAFSDDRSLKYLDHYAALFDLDKKSGIELTESQPKISDKNGIPSAIGQGSHNFATVQLSRYVNTLANRGQSYQLSLVDRIGDEKREKKLESEVHLSNQIWDAVQSGMELYAQSTNYFNEQSIEIAGKSGTAQESKKRPDHGLFVGYAPANQPEISVAVRIVNGYTSGNAVSCANDIFNLYFK